MASTAFNFTSVRAELLMLLATSEHQNDPYSISQFLESPRGKAQHAALLEKLALDEDFKTLGLKIYLEQLARQYAISIYFLVQEHHRITKKHEQQIQTEEAYYQQELQEFIRSEIKRHQSEVQHNYDIKEKIIETLHIYRESIEEISTVIDTLDQKEQVLQLDIQASLRAYEKIIVTLKEIVAVPDKAEQTRMIQVKLSALPPQQPTIKPILTFHPDEVLHTALHTMLHQIHQPKPEFHAIRNVEERYQQYHAATSLKMQALSSEKALQIKNLQKFLSAMDSTTYALSKQTSSTIQKELEKARRTSEHYREALQNYRLQQENPSSGFHPSPFSHRLSPKLKPRT